MADLEGGAQGVVRRNRPGTKAKDMYNWPDQDFNDMETVLAGKLSNNPCFPRIICFKFSHWHGTRPEFINTCGKIAFRGGLFWARKRRDI